MQDNTIDMMKCKRCDSHAINPQSHGRDETDQDLCDVCFWRKRAEETKESLQKKKESEHLQGALSDPDSSSEEGKLSQV